MRWVCRFCDFEMAAVTKAELKAVQVSHPCPKKGKTRVNLQRVEDE